MIIGLTRSFVG